MQLAAATIIAGMADVIIAGGTKAQSTMPRLTKVLPGATEPTRWMPESHPDAPGVPPFDMSVTIGENTARLHGITREQADAWAARSHQRASDAIAKGYFKDEIVGVPLPSQESSSVFTTDEHPRATTTPEKLATLKVLHPDMPGASSPRATPRRERRGCRPGGRQLGLRQGSTDWRRWGKIRGWAAVGVDVVATGTAPVLAIPKALERSGLSIDDVDLFEINEAFATMAVACTRKLGLDESIVNVNGSGVSLGHPIAATGARMVVSMVHELARRDAHIGVVAMCAGGGMGSALVIERV